MRVNPFSNPIFGGLSQLMGHASTKMTEIYLQMVGEKQRRLVMEAWES